MVAILQNKSPTFLIVGLGNIGKRHLESLIKIKDSFIYIYDIDQSCLDKLVAKNKTKRIKKVTSLKEIIKKIDLAIIATNSDMRPNALSDSIKYLKIKNIILEKVVFQKLGYFNKFIKLSKKKKIKIYVNYPRRFWKIFLEIKKEIKKKKSNFEIIYKNNNWGLCCNAIHFIDLFFFFSDKKISQLNHYSFLKKKIYNSKRKGFFELKGTINFECNNNNKLSLSDNLKYKKNVLKIKFGNIMYEIETINDYFYLKKFEYKLKTRNVRIIKKVPKQSELTHKYYKHLANNQEKKFSNLEDSYLHHKFFFNSIKSKFKNDFKNLFPIT